LRFGDEPKSLRHLSGKSVKSVESDIRLASISPSMLMSLRDPGAHTK